VTFPRLYALPSPSPQRVRAQRKPIMALPIVGAQSAPTRNGWSTGLPFSSASACPNHVPLVTRQWPIAGS
jgi:hypothetical protein